MLYTRVYVGAAAMLQRERERERERESIYRRLSNRPSYRLSGLCMYAYTRGVCFEKKVSSVCICEHDYVYIFV